MIKIEFTSEDLMVIRKSLKYSKKYVEEAQGTPDEIRRQTLERIDHVREKLFKHNMGSEID